MNIKGLRMRHPKVRSAVLVALALVVAGSTIQPLAARQAERAPAGPRELGPELRSRVQQSPTELDQQRAEDTRQELQRLMELYPPALGRVIKLDPTLMSNATYMAPYPALATFLQRHPEVPRYPGYFLNFVGDGNTYEPSDPQMQIRSEAMRMWRDVMTGLMIFTGFLTFFLTLGWLVRYIVGHRRWLRATKVQSEVHGRLMERFNSNDELMTYVQSPAGRQFLQGLPVTADTVSAPGLAAPFSRILWSIQAGLVLGCAGIGLLVIKRYVIEEVAQMLLVFGVLAIAIGAGFALAAGASYMLSSRLGLFDAARDGGTNRT